MTDSLHRKSVLIADDTPDNLRLFGVVLKRGGLVARPVMSGKITIEVAMEPQFRLQHGSSPLPISITL